MTRKPTAQMIAEQEEKLAELETRHAKMKEANAVYRKQISGKSSILLMRNRSHTGEPG